VGGRLGHDIHDGILRPDCAEALELASRIDAYHDCLIRWFLLIVQLQVEDAELVTHGACLATLEQYPCFCRGTWH
jgi:hypothetical protein